MTRLLTISLVIAGFVTAFPISASAQYYTPVPISAPLSGQTHQPGGVGLDLGIRNGGFNPNFGFGAGPVGAGIGTGFGRNGSGSGLNVGLGPLGASADSGFGKNGLGVRASSGIWNSGAAFEGGVSRGGLGLGANAKLLGFGPGASLGAGKEGPGLGASLAFGPLGTLLIGSHRNTYPGAQQTESHMYPSQKRYYYTQQTYGNSPYYVVQRPNYVKRTQVSVQPVYYPQYTACAAPWTC